MAVANQMNSRRQPRTTSPACLLASWLIFPAVEAPPIQFRRHPISSSTVAVVSISQCRLYQQATCSACDDGPPDMHNLCAYADATGTLILWLHTTMLENAWQSTIGDRARTPG
eukprot:4693714-Amphidinium_carterae.1